LRKNRTCTDVAMIKLLTFECARAKKSTIGEVSYDCKACFDRVLISQSNILAQKQNMDANFLLARDLCVERLQRHVKTGLGVSVKTYHEEKEEPRVGGEVQGKADVPALYTLNRYVLLEAHQSIAPGLCLQSCTRARVIEHNNVAYSDDTDGHVSAEHDDDSPTESVIEKMRESAKMWNNLVMISGGSLALHKTSWRLLAWEMEKGNLKLISATKEVIMMGDGKGAYAIIYFKSPDVGNEGLGYRICPDGEQKHALKAIMDDMRELCGRISSAQLSEKEARQILYQRLVPKLEYKMRLSSLMQEYC
jgi:hypothetical protein